MCGRGRADLSANGVKVLGEPRQDRIVATTYATNIEGFPDGWS